MASSNRHWPSMFKSKPHLNPWHLNCHTNSLPQAGMNEERTPEPKPRWNPRPEQIRILESIFNSGMVNPPRDEIRKIRAQLQEFGQVGDANVFYWFQNRKSRSKNKHRQQQNPKPRPRPRPPSSSSSSDKSSSPSISSNEKPTISVTASTLMDLLNSPTASVNQPFFQAAASTSTQFLNQPLFDSSGLTQGFGFGDHQESVMNCSNHVLLGDDHGPLRKDGDQHIAPHSLSLTSTTNHILQDPDLGQTVPEKMTVFINDVCFEVATSPFNVREAFGHDTMLIQSSGQPVLTDGWGVTQQPLQHGAFYYVVPTNFTPSHEDRKI